jgi:hypothetical protein
MANLDDILMFVKVAQFESISPGSALAGYADLDGEPAAHDATGDTDCGGFGEDCSKIEPGGGPVLLLSLTGCAHSNLPAPLGRHSLAKAKTFDSSRARRQESTRKSTSAAPG